MPPANRIIAIDGPSGAGKGTVAKLLAERLGFKYLDTGALYRACALKLRLAGLDESASDEDIEKTLAGTAITFEPDDVKPGRMIPGRAAQGGPKPDDTAPGGAEPDDAEPDNTVPGGAEPDCSKSDNAEPDCEKPTYSNTDGIFLDGRDVTNEIRTTQAGHWSSVFSARAPVRRFLLDTQRAAAEGANLVAEGRDMCTVVFPNAWKKIFLTADTNVRAARRHRQLGGSVTPEDALRDVAERDGRDIGRDIAPLRAAPDAVVVDSSHISIDETVEKILNMTGV